MKFKHILIAIATTTMALAASAQSFTPSKPFFPLSKFGDAKVGSSNICWETYKPDFTCSSSDTKCKIALEQLGTDGAACDLDYAYTGTDNRKVMPIPLTLASFENAAPDATLPRGMMQNFQTFGRLEFFYQALMYVPALPSANAMNYSDSKKALQALDTKLNKVNTDLNRTWSRVFDNNQTWGSWNKNKIQTILKAQEASIQKRRNSINFMLFSEDSFNQYKVAFNKFFTFKGVDLPVLNGAALQGKSLTTFECQFLNATEDFKAIQAQYQFTCPKS